MANSETQVVVSGIRATGRLHLGNYLGALQRFAKFSSDPAKKCFFFIADLHSLTTLKDAQLIKEHLSGIVADFLAAGVDSDKAILYAQSSVLETTELSWYLSCLTPVGELHRMPTFKEKAAKQPDDVNAGLLTYTVLMAADIVGPKANLVPVGKDQEPHLELAMFLVRKFNRLYNQDLPIPDALREEMITVPGLGAMGSDGTFAKMGKSDDNTINLSDSYDEMWDKIRVSPTDPARVRKTDAGDPQKCAIYQLHTFASSQEDLNKCIEGCKSASMGCIECKKTLLDNIWAMLEPFQTKRVQFNTPSYIQEILCDGASRAKAEIQSTVQLFRDMMGIQSFRRSWSK